MAIGFYAAAVAQSNIEDVDLIQSIYGKEKKMIVGNFVRLEGFQEDVFWSLYDEYEVKRKELGKRRVAILENMSQPTSRWMTQPRSRSLTKRRTSVPGLTN